MTSSISSPLPGAPVQMSDLARRYPHAARRLVAAHAVILRATRGALTARWFGAPVLLLETVGRRTGRARRVALVYLPDGDDLVVVAANAGAARPPAWWLNLESAGEATVLLGGDRFPVTATVTDGRRRDRLWRRFAGVAPVEHYQRQTARVLPVVALTPRPVPVVRFSPARRLAVA